MAGELTIHGVSRPREIDVELTYEEGPPRVHAVAKFSVDLDDHGISRPQFLFLKLGEVQEVTVDVVAFAGERSAAD
jgi:polyisoprenoid-binding protein YceI